MRFGDVSSRAPTPLLWKKWSTLAHGDAKVAFVGTDANQREREEIKKVFPSALIGCPLDVIPQCGGTMVFAIEQTAMSMYTYFGGFWPSSYSANVATHRLLLGHSIYSMMAFGDQPGSGDGRFEALSENGHWFWHPDSSSHSLAISRRHIITRNV